MQFILQNTDLLMIPVLFAMGWWIRKIEYSLLAGLLFALIVEFSVVVMRTEIGLRDNDILAPSGVLLVAAIVTTIAYKSRKRFNKLKDNS